MVADNAKTHGYKYHAAREEHDYGEIIDSVNFEEDIFEQIDPKHFVRGMAKFVKEERDDLIEGRKTRKAAFRIAKSVYRRRGKGTSLRKQDIIQLVKNAIGEGYIWDFRLEEPWHPKVFIDENRLTTFPFQHKYIVGYSGKPKHLFFTSQGKEFVRNQRRTTFDNFYNPDSILTQGRIRGASGHTESEKGGSKGDETLDVGIWFACLEEASKYPIGESGNTATDNGEKVYRNNVTLEVNVPSNYVIQHTQYKRWETTEELLDEFGSPFRYLEVMENRWTAWDEMDFKLALMDDQSEGEVFLPLEFVQGVWDREAFPNAPHFMPLKDYAVFIKEEFPNRVPDFDQMVLDIDDGVSSAAHARRKRKKKIKNEFDEIREIATGFSKNMNRHFKELGDKIEQSLRGLKKVEEGAYGIESMEEDVFEEVTVGKFEKIFDKKDRIDERLEWWREKVQEDLGRELPEPQRVELRKLYNGFDPDEESWKVWDIEERIQGIAEDIVEKEKKLLDRVDREKGVRLQEEIESLERELVEEVAGVPFVKVTEDDIKSFIRMLERFDTGYDVPEGELLGLIEKDLEAHSA